MLFACKGVSNDGDANERGKATLQHQPLQFIDSALAVGTVKILSSDEYEGRQNDSKGYRMAQAYILKAYQAFNLQPFGDSFLQPFDSQIGRKNSKDLTSNNLVSYLKGTEKPETYLVIGAHYDHIGIHDGEIYNGADDNASGIGGLLALAKYFSQHPPKHSIIFIAFDAEEHGLQGSYHFMEASPVPAKQIAFMLNMDMISQNLKGEIYASGTSHYPFLKKAVKTVNEKHTAIKVSFGHDSGNNSDNWTHASDHAAFHHEGIPFLYFGVEDHKHYHKPTDDFETIPLRFYVSVVDFLCGFALHIDANWEKLR